MAILQLVNIINVCVQLLAILYFYIKCSVYLAGLIELFRRHRQHGTSSMPGIVESLRKHNIGRTFY